MIEYLFVPVLVPAGWVMVASLMCGQLSVQDAVDMMVCTSTTTAIEILLIAFLPCFYAL